MAHLMNPYAGAPAEPWVNPDDMAAQSEAHDAAATFIEWANLRLSQALIALHAAKLELDAATQLRTGDVGKDSAGCVEQIESLISSLEAYSDFAALAEEIRSA